MVTSLHTFGPCWQPSWTRWSWCTSKSQRVKMIWCLGIACTGCAWSPASFWWMCSGAPQGGSGTRSRQPCHNKEWLLGEETTHVTLSPTWLVRRAENDLWWWESCKEKIICNKLQKGFFFPCCRLWEMVAAHASYPACILKIVLQNMSLRLHFQKVSI